MIDYEKLKIAHELILNARPINGSIYIATYQELSMTGEYKIFYSLNIESENGMIDQLEYKNLDDLINKLTDLTEQKRKYKIGECVWFCNGSHDYSKVIIENFAGSKTYLVVTEERDKFYASECYLFQSLMHLINAQQEYWEQLKAVKKAEEFKKSNPSQHLLDASRYLNPHQGD